MGNGQGVVGPPVPPDQFTDDTVPDGFQTTTQGWNHLNFALAHHLPSNGMWTRRICADVLNVLHNASGKRR